MFLNTKLCCFFCLKQIAKEETENSSSNREENINGSLFKLQNLCRFLKIRIVSATESYKDSKNECSVAKDFEVLLCKSCRNAYRNFTRLFLELERIEMEISYWTDTIQGVILEASKTPEVVQEYSKRMTSDVDTLSILPVIDKLRKEIASKCGFVRQHHKKLKVALTKNNKELDKGMKTSFHSQIAVKSESHDSVPILSSFEAAKLEPSPAPDFSPPESPTSPPPSPPVISSKLGGSHKPILLGVHYIKTGNNFKCLSCNKVLESVMGTRFHIRTNHFGKRYKCPKCKDQFTLNINLKKHLKQCNGIRRHRGTPSGYILGKHVTKNMKTGKYDCSSCGKTFPAPDPARNHYIRTHIRRTLKCPKCDGQFKFLKDHLKNCKPKIKREKKPQNFTCDKCKACLKSSYSYKWHVKRCKANQLTRAARGTKSIFIPETGNYKCRICSKEFSNRFSTIDHYDRVHIQRKLKCTICKVAVFATKHFLCKHRKTCRKNKNLIEINDNHKRVIAETSKDVEEDQIKTEDDPTSDCEKEDGSSPNAEDSN